MLLCFEFKQRFAGVCFLLSHISFSLFKSLDFASWPKSLKYLPSGPLQTKPANLCCGGVIPITLSPETCLNNANLLNQNCELPRPFFFFFKTSSPNDSHASCNLKATTLKSRFLECFYPLGHTISLIQ